MTRRPRSLALLASASLTLATLSACGQGGNESTVTLTGTTPPIPVGSGAPQAPGATSTPSTPSTPTSTPPGTDDVPGQPKVVSTITTGLTAPWGLDFFPDGDAIVTERDSKRVLRISADPAHEVTEIGTLDAAAPEGEGGLLGVALSPDFATDATAYFYLTTATDNRIVRATITDDVLGPTEVLLDGIPDNFIHDGGRLAFGPDGYLYASTGEADLPELAPDLDSLGGKILRITTDGKPAPGNPFDSPVWSYGHRNVQGLAFDNQGRLWASEFGQDLFDELNLIRKGKNYGWPAVEGKGGASDYTDPQQVWQVADASPSGLAYADGVLWMAGLRGQRLWQIPVTGDRTSKPKAFFIGDYGRMRTIAVAPDGTIWLTTSNTDGRAVPTEGDDRILQIQP